MCGIAGMMTKDGTRPPQTAIDAMLAAMAHRGPDGTGTHIAGDTALAHGRLSIIDLATGDQPLFAPDGTALIGNGEIYNYVELRQKQPDFPIARNPTAKARWRCMCATVPISQMTCAACTRSRSTIPAPNAWCWRATLRHQAALLRRGYTRIRVRVRAAMLARRRVRRRTARGECAA